MHGGAVGREVIGLLMPRRASEGHEKGIRRVQGNLCAEEMRILENEKISNRPVQHAWQRGCSVRCGSPSQSF